ncbi:hypothetical protein TrST_g9065 [Triparma strigata]|uniref:Uncharacterized protein n=2 Tax=Triparma TaxID=722752 RepID=A0A9W7DVM4_9STRA|nr:hypothetical protein TrST_g9065 [Triparma strigata]
MGRESSYGDVFGSAVWDGGEGESEGEDSIGGDEDGERLEGVMGERGGGGNGRDFNRNGLNPNKNGLTPRGERQISQGLGGLGI